MAVSWTLTLVTHAQQAVPGMQEWVRNLELGAVRCWSASLDELKTCGWAPGHVETEEIKMIAKSRVTSQVAQVTDKYETNEWLSVPGQHGGMAKETNTSRKTLSSLLGFHEIVTAPQVLRSGTWCAGVQAEVSTVV